MITINFEINSYSDALILPDDHGLSNVEIEAIKQQRYNNWYAIVNSPTPLPTEE